MEKIKSRTISQKLYPLESYCSASYEGGVSCSGTAILQDMSGQASTRILPVQFGFQALFERSG